MSDDLQAVNPRARLFRIILSVYGIGIYIFLFAPIAVLILLSFNSSTVVGFPMAGFTTDWYARLSHDNVILDALEKSLFVAFWVTVLATLIGTAAAFPLVRADIKNRGGVRVFITLPIMMPGNKPTSSAPRSLQLVEPRSQCPAPARSVSGTACAISDPTIREAGILGCSSSSAVTPIAPAPTEVAVTTKPITSPSATVHSEMVRRERRPTRSA